MRVYNQAFLLEIMVICNMVEVEDIVIVRIYGKYIIFFVYSIFGRYCNILYLRVNCIQILEL
jgi:hypothetical protein